MSGKPDEVLLTFTIWRENVKMEKHCTSVFQIGHFHRLDSLLRAKQMEVTPTEIKGTAEEMRLGRHMHATVNAVWRYLRADYEALCTIDRRPMDTRIEECW